MELKLHPRAGAASAAVAYGAISMAASWRRHSEIPFVYVLIIGVGLACLLPWRVILRRRTN